MASTWDVDAALLAMLQADSALVGIVTDGIWFGEARATALKYCQVAQIDHSDEPMFQDGAPFGVAYETILYQVKAVIQNTSAVPAINAAVRIEAVLRSLTRATFTPTNYLLLDVVRTQRIRYNERDKANADLFWQHSGGQYQVRMVPTS